MKIGFQWTKLATIVMVIAACMYLGGQRILDSEAVAAILSACLGYVFGNAHGIAERRKD